MSDLPSLITSHPFWHDLPAKYFPALESCASFQTFRPREKIFEKGHSADFFYLVTDGEVSLETPFIPGEGFLSVQTISTGEPLGWSWLFPPYKWNFTVRAITHTEAIVFDAVKLRKLAASDPAFGYNLALRVGGVLTNRLHNTRERLLNICEVA